MANLQDRFSALQRDYPSNSSFVNFVRAVEGQPLSKRRVAFYFDRWVEKDDYSKKDRRAILELLYSKLVTQKQGFSTRSGYETERFSLA